jgi:ketosteroid isomerase-like protein
MSRDTVETVREALEAFDRGGFEAVDGTYWTDDIVWDARPGGVPGLGVYRGREEVRRFFEEDWFAAFDFGNWEIVADEIIDCGERVLVLARQRGRGSASGADVELEFAQVVSFRGDLICRIEIYLDRERARADAGA